MIINNIKMNKAELSRHKNIALSDSDVLKLVENKARIITYPDLIKYKSLDDVLGPHKAIFLLYEAEPDFGHWCAVFKIPGTNTIEFFDSYGGFIDTQLDYIPENFRKISNQDYPHLTALLYNSPYDLTYNEHKFQKHGNDIKTCGRWAALRIALRDLPLDIFNRLFSGVHSDDLATLLTIVDLDY